MEFFQASPWKNYDVLCSGFYYWLFSGNGRFRASGFLWYALCDWNRMGCCHSATCDILAPQFLDISVNTQDGLLGGNFILAYEALYMVLGFLDLLRSRFRKYQ